MIPETWEQLPDELKYIPQWCIAAPDKSPYTTGGSRASVTNPGNWADWYSVALTAAAWGDNAGIGFVLNEHDNFTCIDLDVKDDTPQDQLDRYWKIVTSFDSYTEFSRSGKGLHIWVKGKVGAGCRRQGVEVYSQQRFIICTGNPVPGFNKPVEHRQEMIDILVNEIRAAANVNTIELVEVESVLTDNQVWSIARGAENAAKFLELCEGHWQAIGYDSQSEADLSLLSMFCFYTKSNEQVIRLFRMTGLGHRDKARKNATYLNRTLVLIRARQAREEAEYNRLEAKTETIVKQITSEPIKLVEQKSPVRLFEMPAADSGLDWPPGVVGFVAQWFYSIAPRPVKEVAIVSALGFFAGICGRAYNVRGSGLNLYIVLVAKSAIGKEAMHSGISRLLHTLLDSEPKVSEYIDFADYASGPALVKSLVKRQSFCNIAGEWGRKLRKMSDDHTDGPMASLRTVMTNLYQKSGAGNIVGGIGYSDKDKDIKSTNGVAYSMIGETTPDTFYESLTNTMMADGFMSRFIIIEYNGLRPELNPSQGADLPEGFVSHLSNLIHEVETVGDGFKDVVFTRDAQELVDAFNLECDKNINGTDDESWRQMWNRAHLKTLKIASLLAAVETPASPVVSLHEAQWALKLIRRDIKVMGRKLLDGDVGDGDMVRERKIMSLIIDYLKTPVSEGYGISDEIRQAGVVSRKYLKIRLQRVNSFATHKQGHSFALDSTIRSLVDSGYLLEIPKDKINALWNSTGKVYRVTSLPDVFDVAH